VYGAEPTCFVGAIGGLKAVEVPARIRWVLRIRGDSEAAGVVAVFGRMAGYVLVVFGVDPAERSDGPLDLPAVSVLEGPDGVVAVADSGQRA
jgi:hypothetical protein